MKKIFFLAVFCAGSMMLFAQQVPDAVKRSYQREHRDYNNTTWDMRNNHEWHTRYNDRDHNNRNVDVYYDRYGRRVRMESEWNRDELPQRVRDRVRNRYHDENYNVYRIERPGKGFFFQITLGGNRKVYLDQYGREVRYY